MGDTIPLINTAGEVFDSVTIPSPEDFVFVDMTGMHQAFEELRKEVYVGTPAGLEELMAKERSRAVDVLYDAIENALVRKNTDWWKRLSEKEQFNVIGQVLESIAPVRHVAPEMRKKKILCVPKTRFLQFILLPAWTLAIGDRALDPLEIFD